MTAVFRALGTSLPTVGPGTSARMMCMEWLPFIGSIAMMNTNTPIPPTQCVNERQKRHPRLIPSISVRMDAPVVVKPEAVSNMASMKFGISPLKTKGSAPNADMRIQPSPTMAKPSLGQSLVSRAFTRVISRPSAPAMAMVLRKWETPSP